MRTRIVPIDVRVYDTGCKGSQQYLAVFLNDRMIVPGMYAAVRFGANEQGVVELEHTETIDSDYHGSKVELNQLPKDCRKALEAEIDDYKKINSKLLRAMYSPG
jgi:hypothetical protein